MAESKRPRATVPPEALELLSRKSEICVEARKEPRHEPHTGVPHVGFGAGHHVVLATMDAANLRYLDAVPGFIGAEFLQRGDVSAYENATVA